MGVGRAEVRVFLTPRAGILVTTLIGTIHDETYRYSSWVCQNSGFIGLPPGTSRGAVEPVQQQQQQYPREYDRRDDRYRDFNIPHPKRSKHDKKNPPGGPIPRSPLADHHNGPPPRRPRLYISRPLLTAAASHPSRLPDRPRPSCAPRWNSPATLICPPCLPSTERTARTGSRSTTRAYVLFTRLPRRRYGILAANTSDIPLKASSRKSSRATFSTTARSSSRARTTRRRGYGT
jgi:hypothetical protein